MTSKLILAEKNIKKENDLFFRASQKKQHENKHPKKKKTDMVRELRGYILKEFQKYFDYIFCLTVSNML